MATRRSPPASPPTSPGKASPPSSPFKTIASPATSPVRSEDSLVVSEGASICPSSPSTPAKKRKRSHSRNAECSRALVTQWLRNDDCQGQGDSEQNEGGKSIPVSCNVGTISLPSASITAASSALDDEHDESDSNSTGSSTTIDSMASHQLEDNEEVSVSSASVLDSDSDTISSESRASSDSENSSSTYQKTFLYPNGTSITKEEAVLKLMDLFVEENWSKRSLEKTLKAFKSMLPDHNTLPPSLHLLFQYVKQFGNPIIESRHYYCSECKAGKEEKSRKCRSCGSSKTGYFFGFSVPEQIKYMFENRNLSDVIDSCEGNNPPQNGDICDIQSGTEYKKIKSKLKGKYDVILMWNTDGVAMAKSSSTELWPILCVITNIPPNLRASFMIIGGIWCDKQKPDGNVFLKPFVKSLKCNYESGGVAWTHPKENMVYKSIIAAPIVSADAPARAKVLNVKQFNHKHGCNTCEQKTVRVPLTPLEKARRKKARQRKFYFQENPAELRTGARMSAQCEVALEMGTPEKGVIGDAVVSDLPFFDRAFSVGAEYMHNICLGCCKYFMTLWFHVRGSWYIGNHIKEIDSIMASLKVPDYVKRLPQGISSLSYWKASEFRFWLLFLSPIVLKGRLPDKYYQHWLLLVSACYILLQQRITTNELGMAEVLLRMFVRDVGSLYLATCYTYNVHTLLHLCLLVRRWGPLWSTSAFMFENFNGVLGNLVHGTKNLGQELLNNVKVAQSVEMLRKHIERHNISGDADGHRLNAACVVKDELVLNREIKNPCLSAEEKALIANSGIVNYSVHIRAKSCRTIFTSRLYDEKRKRSNSFVHYACKSESGYGQIEYFIKSTDCVLCLIYVYKIQHVKFILHEETRHTLKHLVPVARTPNIVLIPLCDVSKHIMVDNYFCIRPNTYEVNL